MRPEILADETLWRARLSPLVPAGDLSERQLDHLRRTLWAATPDAIRLGGVHTGTLIQPSAAHNLLVPFVSAGMTLDSSVRPFDVPEFDHLTEWWATSQGTWRLDGCAPPFDSCRPGAIVGVRTPFAR